MTPNPMKDVLTKHIQVSQYFTNYIGHQKIKLYLTSKIIAGFVPEPIIPMKENYNDVFTIFLQLKSKLVTNLL